MAGCGSRIERDWRYELSGSRVRARTGGITRRMPHLNASCWCDRRCFDPGVFVECIPSSPNTLISAATFVSETPIV